MWYDGIFTHFCGPRRQFFLLCYPRALNINKDCYCVELLPSKTCLTTRQVQFNHLVCISQVEEVPRTYKHNFLHRRKLRRGRECDEQTSFFQILLFNKNFLNFSLVQLLAFLIYKLFALSSSSIAFNDIRANWSRGTRGGWRRREVKAS